MNVIAQMSGSLRFCLTEAILFYQGEGDKETFATIHPVQECAGQPVIGPGVCLTRSALEEALAKISHTPSRRTTLPEHVLYAGSSLLAWWLPSARRPIFFNTRDKGFNEDMRGQEVLYPPLVFLAGEGRLHVFALAEDARPTDATPLYRAPFQNLYDNGLMCSGNAKMPDTPNVEEISVWERAFFETNFTHTNLHNEQTTLHPGGHNALWREMRSVQAFPSGALVALKLTLGEALNR